MKALDATSPTTPGSSRSLGFSLPASGHRWRRISSPVKLHGSVNWGWRLDLLPEHRALSRNSIESVNTVIDDYARQGFPRLAPAAAAASQESAYGFLTEDSDSAKLRVKVSDSSPEPTLWLETKTSLILKTKVPNGPLATISALAILSPLAAWRWMVALCSSSRLVTAISVYLTFPDPPPCGEVREKLMTGSPL